VKTISLPDILVIDDEKVICHSLEKVLKKEGYRVETAQTAKEGMDQMKQAYFPLIFLDLKLPDENGMDVLRRVREEQPDTLVIIITGYASVQSAVEAMKLGAYDYLSKPFTPDEIRVVIRRAVEKLDLTMENVYLKNALRSSARPDDIVGESKSIQELLHIISRVGPTDSTVLIIGESGTGKELVARAIHRSSMRTERPFIAVDCGSLVETLFESELFGHVKGSFTGAVSTKHGRLELANNGTIFLDEIGNLSLNTQAKLLRALQEQEITKVGSSQPIKIDIRIICATNQDLMKRVKEGTFREDLYYRISVVPIQIPPLRDRKEDIGLLAHYFIHKYSERRKKDVKGISSKAMRILVQYDWPGNVRELENVLERAIVLSNGTRIEPEDLFYPANIADRRSWIGSEPVRLEDVEKEHIAKVLEIASGNKSEAARLLGIDRKTLRSRLIKYGIESPAHE